MSQLKVNSIVPVGGAPSGGGGGIIQTVTTLKTDATSTTSSSFVDVSGMSRTITPVFASSKIQVVASLNVSGAANSYLGFKVLIGSSDTSIGTHGSGSRTNCTFGAHSTDPDTVIMCGCNFLHTPSYSVGDTLTYKLQYLSGFNNREICLNRTQNDSNSLFSMCGISTLTLMEVSG